MVDGGVAGGTMRLMSMLVNKTISRKTITIIPRNIRRLRTPRIRIGSITRSIGRVPSIRTRTRLRSMGSSVPGLEAGRPHPTHGVTAKVQVTEVVEELKRATSVEAQARKVAEGHKPATSVVGGEKRVLLVDLARAEANVLPVIRARRAGVLPHAALPVREGRGAAAAVDRVAVEEDPLEVAEAEVGEQE